MGNEAIMRFVFMVTLLWCFSKLIQGEDPYLHFEWKVSYGTRTILGTPQRVILINDKFPGPGLNVTTNNNIVLNVFNNLDEPLSFTWHGMQQRKNSWQDGTPGTSCPIPPGTNHTYRFQAKDQIGSYFYYPTTSTHRAAGGFGGIRINSRHLIPVPFPTPEDDFTVLVGDWYTKSHTVLKKSLDDGQTIGRPKGILINGMSGNDSKTPGPMFTMKPDKTYRYRICNVGMKTSFNFRIQSHSLKMVEIEGSHTVQNTYDSLDVHLGQCYSVLVTANQEPKDYYMVASTRFTKKVLTATAIIAYTNGKGPASSDLPKAPVGWPWSFNQFRSFRWNLTASAARPNPQGSYHYGKINISRTIRLANSASNVDGKLRYAINGVSHVNPETPLKLADYFKVADKVFKYNLMGDQPPPEANDSVVVAPNVIKALNHDFVEIIIENHETSVQSWHLAGYSFFPVAVEPGTWSPEKRKTYNLVDAVSRQTIQVYPKSWSAIMTTLDNVGIWNLRSMVLERQYLGEELYISVHSPEWNALDEYEMPKDTILCGIVKDLHIPKPGVKTQ